MKKIGFKSLLPLFLILLTAMACDKENLNSLDEMGSDNLKSAIASDDTAITIYPDLVLQDTILETNACITQYSEDYLTYGYDRYNRLEWINYVRQRIPLPTSASVARYVYMRDKFEYNNAGRLTTLIRYNLTVNATVTGVILTKDYKYNKMGQLITIVTYYPGQIATGKVVEYLSYDALGNMVEKSIVGPNNRNYKYLYSYDKVNRLIKITGYQEGSTWMQFNCDLFYDAYDNIARKEFYYPIPWAASVNDVIRKWVVNYKYDAAYNPFRDFKLPVASLLDWMDGLSPSNVIAISFASDTGQRSVFYHYRYNNLEYPVMRYRINALPVDE